MATRSFIAKRNHDDTFTAIYAHWNGRPEWNGLTLYTHYTTPQAVEALLSMGSVSVLGPTIGRKHAFARAAELESEQCTFYHRDRGDAWTHVKPLTFDAYQPMIDAASAACAQYLYLFDGAWFVAEINWSAGQAYELTRLAFAVEGR